MTPRFNFYAGIDQPLGLSAGTVKEFYDLSQTLNLKSLEFHLYREDFENWSNTSLNDKLFAQEIALIRKAGLTGEDLRIAIQKTALLWIAAEALGEIGNYDSKEGLFLALRNKSSKVRLAAKDALTKSRGGYVVSQLIFILRYSNRSLNPLVRAAAAYTLGQIGDKRAVGELIPLLDDYNLSVKLEAHDALVKLAEHEECDPKLRYLQPQLSQPIVINALINALKNPDKAICDEIAKVLESINNDSVRSSLQIYYNERQLNEEKLQRENQQKYWQKIFSEAEEDYGKNPYNILRSSKWQEGDYAIAGALFLDRKNFKIPLFAILEKSSFVQPTVDAIQKVIEIGKGTEITSLRVLDYKAIWNKQGQAFCDCIHNEGYSREFYADKFLDNPPYKELNNRGLWVFTTSYPIITSQMKSCKDKWIGGLAKPLKNAIISTAVQNKLQDQLLTSLGNLVESIGKNAINEYVLCNLKMTVFHEMGHLFGAPSIRRIGKNKKIEYNYGLHCTDRNCIMSQEKEFFSNEDYIYAAKNRTLPPLDNSEFCKQCKQDIQHFFNALEKRKKQKER